MSDQKFVQYGDKKMPIGNLTLEQAKATMARFFPELADPKIETKKHGDETVYVFTKQAGRKGANAYTPGPWTVDLDSREGGADQIIDPNDMTICFMARFEDDGETIANAYLIAAAPDLRAACESLEAFAKKTLELSSRNPKQILYNDESIAASRAIINALAKARGETQ